jgi:hypothetical protein
MFDADSEIEMERAVTKASRNLVAETYRARTWKGKQARRWNAGARPALRASRGQVF